MRCHVVHMSSGARRDMGDNKPLLDIENNLYELIVF
jgi:hypothetical protein